MHFITWVILSCVPEAWPRDDAEKLLWELEGSVHALRLNYSHMVNKTPVLVGPAKFEKQAMHPLISNIKKGHKASTKAKFH